MTQRNDYWIFLTCRLNVDSRKGDFYVKIWQTSREVHHKNIRSLFLEKKEEKKNGYSTTLGNHNNHTRTNSKVPKDPQLSTASGLR